MARNIASLCQTLIDQWEKGVALRKENQRLREACEKTTSSESSAVSRRAVEVQCQLPPTMKAVSVQTPKGRMLAGAATIGL